MVCCVSPMPLSNPLQWSPEPSETYDSGIQAAGPAYSASRPFHRLWHQTPLHPPFYSCTRHLLTVFPQFRISFTVNKNQLLQDSAPIALAVRLASTTPPFVSSIRLCVSPGRAGLPVLICHSHCPPLDPVLFWVTSALTQLLSDGTWREEENICLLTEHLLCTSHFYPDIHHNSPQKAVTCTGPPAGIYSLRPV